MLTSFFSFTALPPPFRNSSHKTTFDRLSVVPAEERSIKFLLRDELLHQYELLHSSRSTQPHEVPDYPAKSPDAPISAEEPILKEPTSEALLVKCSTSTDIAGPSDKLTLAPIIEEEEPFHHSGKSGDEGIERASPAKQSGDDIFEGLSDLMITSQELFNDDHVSARATSSAVEATSTLQQTSSAQELTLAIKPIISPQTRSGS